MNAMWIENDQNLIPMDTRPEMMPTLRRRAIERVPPNKSWIAKRPSKPAISVRITTAANVKSATAQEARVAEVGRNNEESATFTTSQEFREMFHT